MNIKRLKVLTASLFVIQTVLFVNPVYASPSFIDHPIEALKDFLNSYGIGDNNTESTEDSIEAISGENNNVTVAQSEATEVADDDAVISATLQEILKKQNSSTMILNAEQPNEEELALSTVEAPDIMAEDVSFRDGEDLNKEQEEIREMAYIYADTDYDDDAIREANLPWYSKEYIADSMAYIEDALGVDMGGLGAVTAMASGAFASALGAIGIKRKEEEYEDYEENEEDYAPSGFMAAYNKTSTAISRSSIPLMAFGFDASNTQLSITKYIESVSDMYNLSDAKELASDIYNVAKNYNLDPFILTSLFGQESGFNPFAESAVGAKGIAQFMPETAEALGVDTTNVMSSIDGAARYLSGLLQSYGNYEQALAAYNAGPGNVDDAISEGMLIPPYEETQDYVANILNTASSLIATSASSTESG